MKKSAPKPLLTVSIVTYNSDDYKTLLTSLQHVITQIPTEVFIIDNASKQPIDILAFPFVNLIRNTVNIGYGAAHNIAITKGSGTFYLLLNQDIELTEKTVQHLLEYLEKHPEVNLVGPKLLNYDGTLQYSCRRFPWPHHLLPFSRSIFSLDSYEMYDYDHKKPQQVDWISGACILMRGKHYFDDHYFLYCEDVDLCRNNPPVHYVPEAIAYHRGGYASRNSLRHKLTHTKSILYYYLKHLFR